MEITVSSIECKVVKIHDYHDRNSDLLCIFPQFDDTVEKINSVQREISVIAHSTMNYVVTEKTPTMEELLQAQASHLKCQAAALTVAFSNL